MKRTKKNGTDTSYKESYEAINSNFYDVKNIIRVGTAGVIRPDLKVRDIVIGQGACTNSSYSRQFDMTGIDTAGVKAKYESGVLKLTLPKKVKTEPEVKQLEIE